MFKNQTIAVVGAGNMATALIGGMLRAKLTVPGSIIASRRNEDALEKLRRRWKIHAISDNKKAVSKAQIVILAVKPQAAGTVLEEIAPAAKSSQLFISLMAGLTTRSIARKLKKRVPVVRAMPNTPALVDAGATAIAGGEFASSKDLSKAEAIFASVGNVVTLPENLLDAVTGLSGTGPAYIFMVIEAMIDGGVKVGLPRPIAAKLAAQTVLGAAKLVIESGKHPAILKDDVTTPGGTAITALHRLEAMGLRNVLIEAIVAASKRSEELSRLYAD